MSFEHRLHDRCACGSGLSQYESGGAVRPFVLSGTRRVYERSRPFAIRHIALDLTLDDKRKSIAGVADLHIARVDPDAKELVLDAVGFEIDRVELRTEAKAAGSKKKAAGGWQVAEHVYDGESLRVTVPSR